MKKRILCTLAVALLLIFSLLSISSCSNGKISQPSGLRVDYDSLTLKWSRVIGAYSYEISISGEDEPITTTSNSLSLEYLAPGSYEIKVRALGIDPEKERSKWASLSPDFEREAENGLKYKLINNRTEYEVVGVGSAKGDIVIPELYRGKPVTSITAKAFSSNRSITSVTVGANVRSIGDSAFIKCPELSSVFIPDSVTSIGEYAFQSCKKLSSVTLSNALTKISPYTFSWCSALTEIKLGESLAEVGEYAFSNCESLASVTVSSALDTICEYAFSDCSMLTAMDLSAGTKVIDSFAFSGCTSLSNLKLGDGLVKISDMAFLNCPSIDALSLPESTEEIGNSAFSGCTSLATVELGSKIKRIGVDAFTGTELYENASGIIYLDGWAIVAKDKSGNVNITALAEGTYGIADGAFAGCTDMQTVSLEGIKYIGEGAFNSCPELYAVRFDNALLTVGDYAFSACQKLRSVNIGESVTAIGGYSFLNCSSLLSLDLPDTLTSIGPYAFYGTVAHSRATDVIYVDDWAVGVKSGVYANLTVQYGTRGIADYFLYDAIVMNGIDIADTVEYIGKTAFYEALFTSAIKLPANLKHIGDYAFYGCSSAWFSENGVTVIPEGTEYIGRSAFYGCSYMVGLVIPSTVKTVGDYAFSDCVNLGQSELYPNGDTNFDPLKGDVIIENGVLSIGSRAFQNCRGIIEIVIPDSVVNMGTHVFYKCEGLESVSIGSGLGELPAYTFYKCTSLKSATVSDSVKIIGDYAFRGCEELANLKIGAMTESIGNNSFYGCSSLDSFTIPKTLTSIGNYALRGCIGIETLVIPESVTAIGKYAFYGMNKVTIFCEADNAPESWNAKFNGSYRPLIYGCELSDDSAYVKAFTTGGIQNESAPLATFSQSRNGYEFLGWSSDPSASTAEYVGENVLGAPASTKLYSVWHPGNAENN